MKICIIGFPRSRSSILLETISNYYNIPILGQDINHFLYNLGSLNSVEGNILLTKSSREKEGVIRFHPLQLMDKMDNYKFCNFDALRFKHYDKIYFTARESVEDVIASEFVAYTLNTYTYKSEEELFNNITPMVMSKHYIGIKEHALSEKLVENLKEYLKINNLKFEELLYNDIPQYLQETFPNVSTSHVKTNYNYRNIILNYDDILPLYNQYKL